MKADPAERFEGVRTVVKVLLLAQSYPPDIGGEERHVHALANTLLSLGHEVNVVTQEYAGLSGATDENGVVVHRVRSSVLRLGLGSTDRPHAPPIPDPALTRALRRVLREFDPDVVHAHNWIVNSAVAALVGFDTPLVLTLHDYGHRCSTHRLMHLDERICSGPALRKCLGCAGHHYGGAKGTATVAGLFGFHAARDRRLAHIFAVSTAVADGNRLSSSPVPFSVVPNFIPDSFYARFDAPASAPNVDDRGTGYLLYVGEVTKQKGVPALLRAYGHLPSNRPPLLLAGRVSDEVADSALPDGAELLGPRPHESLARLYAGALVCVVPSVWPDPCPTTTLEAMAAGTPVVGSRIGGIADQIEDSVTGTLVEPGDTDALATAMRELIDDPQRARAMGATARARVRRYTSSVVAAEIEAVYQRLTGATAGRRRPPQATETAGS